MRNVTSAAPHIESRVAASALRDIDTDLVATEAEILVFVFTFCRLEQLILVRRTVRVVTLCAIADCRLMNVAFDCLGIFVGVTGNAERLRSSRRQL